MTGCISCGCAIHDDGPEQTEAWLASMCPECFGASEYSLRDWDDTEGLTGLALPELVEFVDVYLWARPVLARGLTLSVQSWEGRVVAGSILFPGRAVPLSPSEVEAFIRSAA